MLPVEAGFEHCISRGLRIAYGVHLMHHVNKKTQKGHFLLRGNNEVHWKVMHLMNIWRLAIKSSMLASQISSLHSLDSIMHYNKWYVCC